MTSLQYLYPSPLTSHQPGCDTVVDSQLHPHTTTRQWLMRRVIDFTRSSNRQHACNKKSQADHVAYIYILVGDVLASLP